MRSIEDKLNHAYGLALNAYEAQPSNPKRYEIEEIEGIAKWINRMINGECSIKASLEFNLENAAIRYIQATRAYLATMRRSVC
mgnify:CR=1 FL=1